MMNNVTTLTASTNGANNMNANNNNTLLKSPVAAAFGHIAWDALGGGGGGGGGGMSGGGILKLTAQETALLRMAETNPMEYTLADSRDASMYARVLLKLLAESAAAASANNSSNTGPVASLASDVSLTEAQALETLSLDPLGVVSHYALAKLHEILDTLNASNGSGGGGGGSVKGVTTASVFYVGKEGILVEQWKALLRLLNKGGKGDVYAQKVASLCLAKLLIPACPSQRFKNTNAVNANASPTTASTGTSSTSEVLKQRPIQFASAVEPLEAITAWIVSQLKTCTGPLVAICTPALKVLMETPETRALFCKSGGVKYLSRQLRLHKTKMGSSSSTVIGSTTTSLANTAGGGGGTLADKKRMGPASVQQLYELTFCLWILTFEVSESASIAADLAKDSAAVAALCDLVAMAPREKVVRVALAALVNLATMNPNSNGNSSTATATTAATAAAAASTSVINGTHFLSEMIACGLMKAMDHLRDRQFTDPDLVHDVDLLHKLLHDNYKEMSRWEVYKNEVESGHLQWGSTHTEAFFKENAKLMEGSDGDFHLLKVLIALLSSNRDEEVAAVACFDIGEFVRHYPNGRAIAKRLGAKELVMPLIEHENPELQRHALQCVSKIMVHNWEYVK
jgi:V-type H+-transporting ATPase subunit H